MSDVSSGVSTAVSAVTAPAGNLLLDGNNILLAIPKMIVNAISSIISGFLSKLLPGFAPIIDFFIKQVVGVINLGIKFVGTLFRGTGKS